MKAVALLLAVFVLVGCNTVEGIGKDLKKGGEKNFIIVDAGMNDLMRPSLYDAYHNIIPVARKRRNKIMTDIVGPICESGDFLARGREIDKVSKGEYLSVMSAGAYGMSMSSN